MRSRAQSPFSRVTTWRQGAKGGDFKNLISLSPPEDCLACFNIAGLLRSFQNLLSVERAKALESDRYTNLDLTTDRS